MTTADPIAEAVSNNPALAARIEHVQNVARRIARANESRLPARLAPGPAVALVPAAPGFVPGPDTLGPLVARLTAHNATRWAAKGSTYQTRQRIDEIVALALPELCCAMNAGQKYYGPGKPPLVGDAARTAVASVVARGWADDLADDSILAAAVRAKLEGHWSDALEQRAREARTASRSGNAVRRPAARRGED